MGERERKRDVLVLFFICTSELIPHETVVKELVADTVDYGTELGVGGERFSSGLFSQALFVTIKVQVYVFVVRIYIHVYS